MSVYLAAAGVVCLLMFVVWLASLRKQNAGIVDLYWGPGFVLIVWTTCTVARSDFYLLPVLTTVWGLRLSVYLTWRNHGQPEDFRYQAMRRHHGRLFPMLSLFTVFSLQGLVMWTVSLPLQAGVLPGSSAWTWLKYPGIVLWLSGLLFESVGDWQLARFRSRPENHGLVLDTGLWRYTRHPNYFGDFLVWWGLFFVAVSHSNAWWTAVGPLVMSGFLRFVSGVTLLEKTLTQSKPQYADYIAQTNAFFPGPPRRSN